MNSKKFQKIALTLFLTALLPFALSLPDLRTHDMNTTSTIFDPNSSINVFGTITNDGNEIAINFQTSLFYDGNLVSTSVDKNLDINASIKIDFNYSLPPDFYGQHELKITTNHPQNIVEKDYSNNSQTIQITKFTEADLLIKQEDINFVQAPKNGIANILNFKLKNQGEKTANNITIDLYYISYNPQNYLKSQTLASLGANQSQNLSFSFTPQLIGLEQLVLIIDKNNTIIEENKNNNTIVFSYTVAAPDQNLQIIGKSLTVFVQEKDCFYWLSNDDSLAIKDFNHDSNRNFVKIELINGITKEPYKTSDANALTSGWFKEGDQIQALGVLVNFVQVNVATAIIQLTYPKDVTIYQTTCVTDLKSCQEQLGTVKKEFEDYKFSTSSWQYENNDLRTKVGELTLQTIRDGNALNDCKMAKETCQTNLSNSGLECNRSIELAKANEASQCSQLITTANSNINFLVLAGQGKDALNIALSIILSGIAIFYVLWNYGGLKEHWKNKGMKR